MRRDRGWEPTQQAREESETDYGCGAAAASRDEVDSKQIVDGADYLLPTVECEMVWCMERKVLFFGFARLEQTQFALLDVVILWLTDVVGGIETKIVWISVNVSGDNNCCQTNLSYFYTLLEDTIKLRVFVLKSYFQANAAIQNK